MNNVSGNNTTACANENGDLSEECRNRPPLRREFSRSAARKSSNRTLPSLIECPSDQNRETEHDSLNESYIDRRSIGLPGRDNKVYHSKLKSDKKLLSLLSYDRSHILGRNNPLYSFWIVLSSLYGVLLLVIMFTICVVEIMDNPVKLYSLQGMYLMYLYVGSIIVIICIYIWVLKDSYSKIRSISSNASDNEDFSHFGSLKRAHISPTKTSSTSFYLRLGALLFGLGTLVFNGLEMAMRSMMDVSCLTDVIFFHPILNGLFTFLQMHFLFVNSQVLVEKFGLIARFGFIHLSATSVALWLRLIIWETGLEWIYFVYLAENNNNRNNALQSQKIVKTYNSEIPNPLELHGFPRTISHHYNKLIVVDGFNRSLINEPCLKSGYNPISDMHMEQIVSLHYCINANSLGQLWSSSLPFLYPFAVQFSLIAAGVTFVMSQNVGMEKLCKQFESFSSRKFTNISRKRITSEYEKSEQQTQQYLHTESIDCNGISKGLFLGLLCMVIVIVTAIIFLVVKDDDDFPPETWYWLTSGSQFTIMSITILINWLGLCRIRKLSYIGTKLSTLDSLLSTVSVSGVLLYSIFGIVVGMCGLLVIRLDSSADINAHTMLLVINVLQIVQTSLQSTFIAEALQRGCTTRNHQLTKPGRQVVTFLLCSNIALWIYDSFVTQSWLSQELQLRFCGLLLWGVISRLSLPLLVFYRFHSAILLLEIWHRCYTNSKHHLDPFN